MLPHFCSNVKWLNSSLKYTPASWNLKANLGLWYGNRKVQHNIIHSWSLEAIFLGVCRWKSWIDRQFVPNYMFIRCLTVMLHSVKNQLIPWQEWNIPRESERTCMLCSLNIHAQSCCWASYVFSRRWRDRGLDEKDT